MNINIQEVYKKYDASWVIKNLNFKFDSPNLYAIIGNNGSGKSTLLKMLAGMQPISKGRIEWSYNNSIIKKENIFKFCSYCAPGMDIIEEMTLQEFLHFHFSFKKMIYVKDVNNIIDLLQLHKQKDQKISEFSSGMKQRVKLAQAFFSDTPLLMLDEPTSNLDEDWSTFYEECLKLYTRNRLTCVASNLPREYKNAKEIIDINLYK